MNYSAPNFSALTESSAAFTQPSDGKDNLVLFPLFDSRMTYTLSRGSSPSSLQTSMNCFGMKPSAIKPEKKAVFSEVGISTMFDVAIAAFYRSVK